MSLESGFTLGSYEIVSAIGAGGMGEVYRARDAKLLASLNHPGIATLYAFDMELVEGETLAERITRGPMAWDDASPLFVQMAEALEAAHDKSIVHRDLKPAVALEEPPATSIEVVLNCSRQLEAVR